MKKNIVLLGGSNSVRTNGLQKGIEDEIAKIGGYEFYNLALGACTSFQNLYEIKRQRNQALLQQTELIITESNANEVMNNCHIYEQLPLEILYRNLNWFYKELYFLNVKVVSLLLPNEVGNYEIINNMHRELCNYYGFNCIDMQQYYKTHNLSEFGKQVDWAHQLSAIMYELGGNIIKHKDNFLMPKHLNITNDNPKLYECSPDCMEILNGKLQQFHQKNSMYDETMYRINSDTIAQIPSKWNGYHLIGVHVWNTSNEWQEKFHKPSNWDESCITYSRIEIANEPNDNTNNQITTGGGGGKYPY